MERIVIGIDGGGTKTAAVAMDFSGRALARARGKSINYNLIPPEQAAGNVERLVDELGGGYEVAAVAIGDPSIDEEPYPPATGRFVQELRARGVPPSNAQLLLKSDAFMALYGLTRGEKGVLVIAGTGSMAVGLDERGDTYCAGGWGYPTDDEGSACFIAVRALEAVFAWEDGVGERTDALADAALRFFGASTVRGLIPVLNDGKTGRSALAAFAPEVARCAREGDAAAARILADAAESLARRALSLVRRTGADRVGMYGGVFEHNETVRKAFSARLLGEAPGLTVGFPLFSPEEGAALAALDGMKEMEER